MTVCVAVKEAAPVAEGIVAVTVRAPKFEAGEKAGPPAPRPPAAVTTARATRRPDTRPTPNLFPSMLMHPLSEGS